MCWDAFMFLAFRYLLNFCISGTPLQNFYIMSVAREAWMGENAMLLGRTADTSIMEIISPHIGRRCKRGK